MPTTLKPPPTAQPSLTPIRKMDWDSLVFEYDLHGQRLLPWEGLKTPFGGAWCIVAPGTFSLPHNHAEREFFICVSGTADIVLDGKNTPVTKGDQIAIPPNTRHYIDNREGQEDFHFYTIWWDENSARDYADRGDSESLEVP